MRLLSRKSSGLLICHYKLEGFGGLPGERPGGTDTVPGAASVNLWFYLLSIKSGEIWILFLFLP